MKIRPLRGYCVVAPDREVDQTASGVYLPDRIQEKQARGEVLAVGEPTYEAIEKVGGPRAIDDCLQLKGKTVIFKKYVDNKVKEGEQEYLLVPFSDLLATYGDD